MQGIIHSLKLAREPSRASVLTTPVDSRKGVAVEAPMHYLTLVSANWEIWPRIKAHSGPVNSGPVQILLIPSL
jgi:hypothetical protein